ESSPLSASTTAAACRDTAHPANTARPIHRAPASRARSRRNGLHRARRDETISRDKAILRARPVAPTPRASAPRHQQRFCLGIAPATKAEESTRLVKAEDAA